ncbi:hypothetical protein KM043_013499 [Ampulex compressa]|nr:hypothetical protein KM043_013499 [Ampulex compressa]
MVFYQVYPRSFMDHNNDGIGDLKGITAKLEHFVDAGVGGIWLSPIYSSPMIDFGYDISNFTQIDPIYGTLDDFERLTARARKLGVKVILDFVPNHTSDKHQWFQKSVAGDDKYKDYYTWRKGRDNNKSPPNNWISVFNGPAWEYNENREEWYLHQFEYRQVDLNYSNPNVRTDMEDVIKFWLGKGVDGFRVDAVPYFFEDKELRDEPRSYNPKASPDESDYLDHIYTKDDPRTYDLIRSWRNVLDEYSDAHNEDEKVMMTEAYTSLDNTTRYYQYGSQIPFNFQFIGGVNKSSTPADFKKIIDDWIIRTPPGSVPNWVMGNHDNSRLASRFPGREDQMIMLEMILPGVAVTYYGEEIGMVDKRDISWEDTQDRQACLAGKANFLMVSRDPVRTPFQWDNTKDAGFSRANSTWLPVNANYKELNLKKQKASISNTHYKVYQKLIRLRKSSPALYEGTSKNAVLNNNKVLAIARESKAQTVILLINFDDDSSQLVDLKRLFKLYRRTHIAITSVNSNLRPQRVDPSKVTLPAKATVVLISEN